jgi:2-dehydro-3-deoxyphosphogalactonate aldolase
LSKQHLALTLPLAYDLGMNSPDLLLRTALKQSPLMAILRGITPQEAPDIGKALWDAGFRVLEVPLNSPQALESIALLREALPQALVGAGTVLQASQVAQVKAAGGQLVIAPNFDVAVCQAALQAEMQLIPGVATPSEAFAALAHGAHALKLFPAEMISPAAVKAMRAVLPRDALLIPVGGINAGNMAAYWQAGANGFGIGGTLYQSGKQRSDVYLDAIHLVALGADFIRARGLKFS